MNVLVVGLGNVGTTLLAALLDWQHELDVSNIFVARRQVPPWETDAMTAFEKRGVTICTLEPGSYPQVTDITPDIQFVFHCGPNKSALEARSTYDKWPSLMGAVGQGSEKGFGPSFMSGVFPENIDGARFVHVVSCNTHGLASVLRWVAGDRLEHLKKADAVIVRRSEDLCHHERLVGGPVVARHRDAQHGTHLAVDIVDLFAQNGIQARVTTSDVTTQGQLLHTLRFQVVLDLPIDQDRLLSRLEAQRWLAKTSVFDGNRVFEKGRRFGFQGRLFSHAIVVSNNLLIDGCTVSGWAFVPQEGNTIGSTIEAFLRQTRHPKADAIVQDVCQRLVQRRL